MFRHKYDIHPRMHTRRASNIYTDIPRNKVVINLQTRIILKLSNNWMEILHYLFITISIIAIYSGNSDKTILGLECYHT